MRNKKRQTTGKYLRRRFIKVILATLGFALIPLIVLMLFQAIGRSDVKYVSASDYLADSYEEIDTDKAARDSASITVVDKDLNVIHICGDEFINESRLSEQEWGDFLKSTGAASKYQYDTAFNEDYWLVVRKPQAVTFSLAFFLNSEAPNYFIQTAVFFGIFSLYIIALVIFVAVYSGKAAKPLTDSVKEVSDNALKFEKGEYKISSSGGETIELDRLGETMVHLAGKLKEKEEIQKNEEEKRMLLVSELSHDLKTPLASIQGFSEMLLNGVSDEEKEKDYLKLIHDNSIRSNEILQMLFMYSKLGSAGYSPSFERTDICEVTRQIVAEYVPLFEDAGFSISIDVPEEEISVMMNVDLFRRVYDNIFNNSIKYNEAGTKVELSLRSNEENVEIHIADDGVGIPEEHVDKIFTPFYRIETNGTGSGLGLAIVKRIVDLHNGVISYVSRDGSGCGFLIIIPRLKD
ncbi:MAG: HAMP domain-containing histidine kinase [Lachnospiraceae bacterium]|nr:HAMP domain-containing histidine kinase [Clostridiales bacterium]MBR7090060.1 HAMP domain-containing histidine kinase [Lachnospiraceae bacterium]